MLMKMDLFERQNRQLEAMLERNHVAARAREFGIREREYRRMIRRMDRRRRAEICQNAEVVLFFASGSGVTFGFAAHYFALGILRVVCAMAFAVVCAAVGFWCDKWSRS